jgi:DNA invertase Pin-like site-specific DNA recombinase
MISQRTKAALAEAEARGKKLGKGKQAVQRLPSLCSAR